MDLLGEIKMYFRLFGFSIYERRRRLVMLVLLFYNRRLFKKLKVFLDLILIVDMDCLMLTANSMPVYAF